MPALEVRFWDLPGINDWPDTASTRAHRRLTPTWKALAGIRCKMEVHVNLLMDADAKGLAEEPRGRPRRRGRLSATFTVCAGTLALLAANLSAAAPVITVKACEGAIKSDFETLTIDAEWKVAWPVQAEGVPVAAMDAIRKQICADVFGGLFEDGKEPADALYSERLDYAQLALFRLAVGKVEETEDSFTARALDFRATLKVTFASDGYIGYRLEGYHNEGGNGCHSYVTARVMSLSTGAVLRESDFIATNRFSELYALIVKRACEGKKTSPFDPPPAYDPKCRLFDAACYMLEPEGIRWYLPPYSVFPGCAGVVDALVTWDDLKPFFREAGYCNAFRALNFAARVVREVKE